MYENLQLSTLSSFQVAQKEVLLERGFQQTTSTVLKDLDYMRRKNVKRGLGKELRDHKRDTVRGFPKEREIYVPALSVLPFHFDRKLVS